MKPTRKYVPVKKPAPPPRDLAPRFPIGLLPPAPYDEKMLLGRDDELAVVRELLEGARRGRSGTLVITGEAGIGKTTLLEYARTMSGDALVLSTAGVEGESDVPYVHLADIFRSVHGTLAEIPDRQAASLASVLAIGQSTVTDRFTVAAASLSVFGALANRGPVTVSVDDAQWVDHAS